MKKLIVILFVFCATVSSCKKELVIITTPAITPRDTIITPSIPTAPTDTPSVNTYHYLALGDSYTIGQSVAINERFPVQTADKLKASFLNFYDPEIIAQTGWTTGSLLNQLAVAPPLKNKYDVVSLLIGVNNQYRRQSQSQYSTEFTTLLSKAISYAENKPTRVFVLSIPDYSVTPFASGGNQMLIAKQIDSFNTINQQITKSLGANYLYITNSTRQAATDRTLIASDGLHPSGKEYKKWADSLAPMIQRALR